MKSRNTRAIILFLIFYISFGVWLMLFQERVIYQPGEQVFDDCPALHDAAVVTHNGTRMYVNSSTGPTVLLYHGNAGSACDRAFYADLFTQANFGYVLVEYAGYSNDPRRPTHELLKQDVHNVIDYLDQTQTTDILIVGESIGTGFASYHTSLIPPSRLLLITPFTDLAALARKRFWFYPTNLLVDNALDNTTALAAYPGPVAIIHGTDDGLIPFTLGQQVAAGLGDRSTLIAIDGAGHNDLFTYPTTYAAINEFLAPE
jgi:pimeloyl-ACP methyl ester carboxylesterase